MSEQPSTHGTNGNGRTAGGTFAKGNRLGRGNPLAGRAAKIRAVLLRKLTPADAGVIADKLIAMAKAGDLAATKELLDRCIGKAEGSEMRERVDALEELVRNRIGGANGRTL